MPSMWSDTVETRMDEDSPILMRRATEYLMAKVYEAEYPNKKGRIHCPYTNEANPGSQTITQQLIDRRGKAQITDSPGRNFPLVGLTGAQLTQPVRSIEQGYEVNFQEVRAAMMANINIADKKALAAREFVQDEEERITYIGDQSFGLDGLFHPRLPRVISNVNFNDPALTIDDALRELNRWANLVYDVITAETYQIDSVLFPSRVASWMRTNYRNSSSDLSVMKVWRESNDHIKFVDTSAWCSKAGNNESPAALFYCRQPDHVQQFVPQDLEQMVAYDSQVNRTVLIHERHAGVFYHKLSAVAIEGLWY